MPSNATTRMNPFPRLLLFCLACWQCGMLAAQEPFFRNIYEPKSGSYVEVTSLFSKLPASGFAPVRVTIANRLEAPASVSLNFLAESNNFNSGKLKTKSSFVATSPGGTTTTTDYLVPVAATVKEASYGNGHSSSLTLSMVGVTVGQHTQTSSNLENFPYLLMSEALSTPNGSALDSELAKVASGSGGGYMSSQSFAGKFLPSMMPEDWRAYAGYDGILMTDQDWLGLPPGARSAILQWNRNGGYLRLFASSPSSTLASLSITSGTGGSDTRGKGTVKLTTIPASLALDVPAVVNEFNKSSGNVTRQAQSAIDDYSTGGWGLQNSLGTKTFHFLLFIIVLIAFGVLVGPVNLFVFAKSGMRHKLFITTPIIALSASVLMILLIFVQDGFGGRGIRIQWIELVREDSDNNAYIHQEQISRTGVLVGNRFVLTEPATIIPLPLMSSQWTRLNSDSNNDQAYEMNFIDKGLQVSGDWFQSRSEQAQLLKAVVPTRARIESTDAANDAALLSNFEYEISDFYYRGKDGKFWRAESIASGKNFLARECTQADFLSFVSIAGSKLGKLQQDRLLQLSQRPGYYIATTSQAPMIETFTSITWTESQTIITGRVQSPEAP